MNTRINRILLGTIIAGAIALLLIVSPMPTVTYALGSGVDIQVSTTVDESDTSGNGTGCSLREAIHAANIGGNFGGCFPIHNLTSNDTLLLPSGTYTLTRTGPGEDLDITGDLDIQKSVIISATGAMTPTVIGDPNTWNDRIFHILTGTVTFKHMAIRGGNETLGNGGGAVRIDSGASLLLTDSELAGNHGFFGTGIANYGTATLTNVVIDGNFASSGGGIYNSQGAITMTNVAFSSNQANYGGGIRNDGGTMTLIDVILAGNDASTYGGGVYTAGGTMTLTNLTLSANRGGNNGGGIYNDGSTLTLTNVTLDGNNNTQNGAGIYNNAGTAALTNVTFSGNSASANGGGVYVNGGAAIMTNVTLSGNHANTFGGGIFNDGVTALTNVTLYGNYAANDGGIDQDSGTATLTNTIVANNTGGDCGGIIGGSFNLSSDNNCGFGARGNINVKLLPLADYGGPTLTHMLAPGSPAIDFGTNIGCPSTDQRGFPRPANGICDVGAVERQMLLYLPFLRK